MNKNMEKEYRELMKQEVPELWDRIEAGLEPKKTAAEKEKRSERRIGGSRRIRYRAWGIAAAVCLCLAAVGLGTAYPYGFDATPGKTGGDGNAEGWNNSPQMEAVEWAGGAAAEDAPDGMGEGGDRYFPMEDSAKPAETVSAPLEVRVRVLEAQDRAGEKVYTVQVEESDSEELSEGDIIRVCGSGIPEEGLTEQESYRMELDSLSGGGEEAEYSVIAVGFPEYE